jgi:hypothetical protein
MKQILALYVAALILGYPADSAPPKTDDTKERKGEITESGPAILWQDPADISSRDLF